MIERRLVGRQVTTLGTIPAPFRTAADGPPIIQPGLVGYWDFGNAYSYDGSSSTVTDLSGNSRTGTLQNNPTFSPDRRGFLTFDGSDDHVAITGTVTVSAATFIAWIRRNGSQSSYAGILFDRDATGGVGADTNGIMFNGTTNKLGYIWEEQSNTWQWDSNLTVPDAKWCMVAVSVASSSAVAYLCTDTGITSATNSVSHATTAIGGTGFAIGSDLLATPRPFKGDGAVFMLYNRALSQSDIYHTFSVFRGRFNI